MFNIVKVARGFRGFRQNACSKLKMDPAVLFVHSVFHVFVVVMEAETACQKWGARCS